MTDLGLSLDCRVAPLLAMTRWVHTFHVIASEAWQSKKLRSKSLTQSTRSFLFYFNFDLNVRSRSKTATCIGNSRSLRRASNGRSAYSANLQYSAFWWRNLSPFEMAKGTVEQWYSSSKISTFVVTFGDVFIPSWNFSKCLKKSGWKLSQEPEQR